MAERPEEAEEEELLVPGEPGYTEALRRDLDRRKPTTPQDYNLEEVHFWIHRHMPLGSVLEFKTPGSDVTGTDVTVALMVTSCESDETGLWLGVSVLGSEQEAAKKSLQGYFKAGRRMVHLCQVDRNGMCSIGEEDGLHVRQFRWYPPGDFKAAWLSAYAVKKVKDGVKLALGGVPGEDSRKATPPVEPGEVSETERRLSALRRRSPRVSFAEDLEPRPTSGQRGGDLAGQPGGILRRPGRSSSPAARTPALLDQVKKETIDLTKRSRSPTRDRRSRRRESTLVAAATAHQENQVKREDKRERKRSRSRRKRSRDRRRRRSRSSSRSSRSRSSSTSSSLLPPLRRKSQKKPGSVFRLLEQQAYDFLAQDGVLEDRDPQGDGTQRPKLFTYYQLGLKPALDPRGRDAKELGLLCRALDMLKEGKLDSLSDLLAARLMAVETATKQGWATARHLELYDGEDEGTAPPHVLLAAQRHGKQVERAGGKGSWPRAPSWPSAWYGEGQGKGRGKDAKGKGKKGKGKGKAGKQWQQWGPGDKDKKDGKNPAEGAT